MKSEGVILENKRTHIIKVKSEIEVEGKILGLFDEYSYREEQNLRRISSDTFHLPITFHPIYLSYFVIFSFNFIFHFFIIVIQDFIILLIKYKFWFSTSFFFVPKLFQN